MAGIPRAVRHSIIDENFGVSPSVTLYAALTSTAPTDTAAGTELSGNGYARQAITFSAAASDATSNTNAPTFTASGGAWPEVVGIEIYTALTGGTRVFFDVLDTPKTAAAGDTLTLAVGDLDYSWTEGS